MRSRTALVLVVFALALLAALWRWQGQRGERTRTDPAPSTAAAERAGLARGGETTLPPPAWFAREDVKPRRIAGRVTLDGKPAAATVTLASQLTRAGRGKPAEITTGPDGVFDLGTWPAGAYTIAATAPGVRAAVQALDLSDPRLAPDQLELRLHTCVTRIEGTITDAVGAAVEDALVARDGVTLARSDAKGAYAVCVPPGALELEYTADGYGAVVLGFFLFDSTTQDVVLVPGAAITGRAVRADDGEAVAGAFVTVGPQEWARDRAAARSAITDEAGGFRIEGLVPGRYRAWAFADGLASEAASPVEAQLGVTSEVVVKLVARGRIRGTVMNGTTPVPGVEVTAVRKLPSSRSRPAFTQLDGSFVLDDVPVGELVFAVEDHEVTAPTTFRAEKGTTHEGVVIQIAAMASLRGVVTRLGLPVEGATVWGARSEGPVFTDASGRYEALGLEPGTYQVGAGSDEIGAFTTGTTVTLSAGEARTLDLELDLAAEVSGTVVDADGTPVKGVYVRWTHVTTQDEGRSVTDAAGRYRCRSMQGGGTYKALVFATAQAQKPFPPAPGTSYPTVDVVDGKARVTGVTIAIDRQVLPISGVVVDASGAPVVDAQVKATSTDGREPVFDMWRRLPTTATDADGRFTLSGLVAGTYAVQARSGDGGEVVARDVVAGARDVRLVVVRPGAIEGRLEGFTHPAVVYATPWNAPHKLLPGTVDGASFRVSGVKPGRYLVNAQNASEGAAALVDVRSGAPATVTLAARGHGVIEGQVLDWKTRAPLAGAVCRTDMSIAGQQGLTSWDPVSAPRSDARGRVIIDPAPAGDVSVVCEMSQPRHAVAAADVTVAAGGRATVTLYSAEMTVENPGTFGADFQWMTTPPRLFQVVPGGPAARAGLQNGDLVVAVDGEAVAGLNGAGVHVLILNHPIGTKASLTIARGAQRKTVEVELTAER